MSADERCQVQQGHKALIAAAKKGLVGDVAPLAKLRVDINKRDLEGRTALHHAARHGHIRVVEELVKHQANAEAATPLGYTPLMLAASHGHGAVVEYLLAYHGSSAQISKGAAPPQRPATSTNIYLFEQAANEAANLGEDRRVDNLVTAVKNRNLAGAARMIAAESRERACGDIMPGRMHVEEVNSKGESLLIQACRAGDVDMVQLLLCAGASIDTPDRMGRTPLMHAVKEKQPAVVATLLRVGAQVEITDRNGASALSMAIDSGHVSVMQSLVQGKVDLWKSKAHDESLLVYAALNGKEAIAKALVNLGIDPPDNNGSRSLAILAQLGKHSAVAVLLKAGADPGHKACDGHTAFTLAAANGRDAAASALLNCTRTSAKTLQAQTDNQGRTALMLAVLNNRHDMAGFLLKNQADPHQRDHAGRNAFLWAVARSDNEMVTLLINNHATHVSLDNRGNNMFIIAAAHDNRNVLKTICLPRFVNSQVGINTPNKDGDTALIEAARQGFLEMVDLLIQNGANVLHSNAAGRTALHEAAAHGHMEVITTLQARVAALPPVFPYANQALTLLAKVPLVSAILPLRIPVQNRALDKDGNSLTMLAASNGHGALLNSLLKAPVEGHARQNVIGDAGADADALPLTHRSNRTYISTPAKVDLDQTNREGMNALCMAIRHGHYATIELLINGGARVIGPLARHESGYPITPLWLAARLTECAPDESSYGQVGHTPELVVDLLLKSGAAADVNARSWQGQTPLIAAAGAGQVGVVRLLTDAGARVNEPDEHQLTALMHAAHHGHADVVRQLITSGATVDPRSGKLSALILAAESGREAVIKVLVHRGAKIDHADAGGSTALIGAARGNNASTVQLLISLGASLFHTTNGGHDALYYAKKTGHHDIVKLLQDGYPTPRDH